MNDSTTIAAGRHRIFGFFRAPETAAGFILLVFLLFFWTWARLAGENEAKEPTGPIQVSADIIEAEGGFTLNMRGDRELYVALFLVGEDDEATMLFPRLGPPQGLPWPLDPERDHRLPGSSEVFRQSLAEDDRVIVVARSDRVAGSMDDIPDDPALGIAVEAQRKSQ